MGPLGSAGSLDDVVFAAVSGAVFGIVYVAWSRMHLFEWIDAILAPWLSTTSDTVRRVSVIAVGLAIASIAALAVWLPVLLMAVAVDAI